MIGLKFFNAIKLIYIVLRIKFTNKKKGVISMFSFLMNGILMKY